MEGKFLYPCYILVSGTYMMRYAFSLLNILLFAIICFFDKQILSDYGFSVVWILMFSFIGVIFFSYKNCIKVKCIKAVFILGIFCFFYLPFIKEELAAYQKEIQTEQSFNDTIQIQSLLEKQLNLGEWQIFQFLRGGKIYNQKIFFLNITKLIITLHIGF